MTEPRTFETPGTPPQPGEPRRILAAWYSRTGSTEALVRQAAGMLLRMGHRVTEAPILPRFELPYPACLALSFLPGSRVPLREPIPDPAGFDACLLALPKWTFSCPPANAFLARRASTLPPTALLVTCGGWGEHRFVAALRRRLERHGVRVLGGLALERNLVYQNKTIVELRLFLADCFPATRPDGT
jgi:hypothetical protein